MLKSKISTIVLLCHICYCLFLLLRDPEDLMKPFSNSRWKQSFKRLPLYRNIIIYAQYMLAFNVTTPQFCTRKLKKPILLLDHKQDNFVVCIALPHLNCPLYLKLPSLGRHREQL